MEQFEVGAPYPGRNPMPGQEYSLAEPTAGFFNIVCFMQNPSAEEIRAWRKGKLHYGIFAYDNIPFFIIDFPADGWNIDASLNILKIQSEDAQEAWLNSDGNAIVLYLVDSKTGILKAMRMIGIKREAADELRDVLEKQTELYDTSTEVELRAASIQHALTTAQMINRTQMRAL